MFHYSFSTVYMTIIFSNILLVLVAICFRSKKFMVNVGYRLLALLIGFTLLRFLFPFELPFTATVLLSEPISRVISFVRYPLYEIGGFEISIWTVFEGIWLAGFMVNLIRYIRIHRKARYYVLSHSLDISKEEPYHSLLDQICRERKKRNRFQILQMSGIKVPMIYGVFSPCILIPETMELTRENLYYALAHEASHHFHHDLLIKKAIKLLTIIYWWNPVCYILNKQVDMILEMRVDDNLTAADSTTVDAYLHCLVHIAQKAADNTTLPKAVAMGLLPEQNSILEKRFHMLMAGRQKKNWLANLLLLLIVAGIYVFSYVFIWEAHYANPLTAATSIGQTADNSYAILKEDGTYDIYYQSYFIENTDSLKLYTSDIPVYTEKEFINEEH